MGKLSNISGRDAAKAFEKAGWLARGQAGSHLILTKANVRANLTVPLHAELAPGTLRALIRVSGLTIDEFLSLL
jgi:predicted RNA binding protein YcfA (HicA-like mRNA interferase family)